MKKFTLIILILIFIVLVCNWLGFLNLWKCLKSDTFWTGAAAIASFCAVFVALFITKWQDKIANRKELKIEWNRVCENRFIQIALNNDNPHKKFNGINIKCTNTGNRKIILNGVSIEAPDKKHLAIQQFWTFHKIWPEITFPCVLETEMAFNCYLPNNIFYPVINKIINSKMVTLNDEIVIIAYDTAGELYRLNTHQKFRDYFYSDES